MAKIEFEVTYADGRAELVKVGPKGHVACERHFKTTMGSFAKDPSAEALYYLAWVSLHLSGREPADFDTFLDNVDDVSAVEAEDNANPTERGPSPDTSSS